MSQTWRQITNDVLAMCFSAQSFKISCSSGNGFGLVYEDLLIDFGRTNFSSKIKIWHAN